MMIWSLFAVGVTAAAYFLWIRSWHLKWGATDEEYARSMPGDHIVDHPHFAATRSITVNSPPEALWPWIIQIGFGRAGWYSYDFIDHLGQRSAWKILPQFQQLAVGDDIPFMPWNLLGMRVIDMELNHWMVWQDRQDGGTWLWLLEPLDKNRTRLITRRRIRYRWMSLWIIYLLLQDAADFVMMRKCMLGLKTRAELLRLDR